MTRSPTHDLKTAAFILAVIGLLLWLDTTHAQAGAWALLLLSVSVGFVHGALDAVLVPQRFNSRALAALLFVAYGVTVLLLGWLLSFTVSWALWLLLIMSAWHFGEPYGRWGGQSAGQSGGHLGGQSGGQSGSRWSGPAAWQSGLTRAVVGGAPVMLPVWLAPEQVAVVLQHVVPGAALQGWHNLAWLWLGLLVVWLVVCGVGQVQQMRALRFAWLELLGCLVLYAVFSPLMAFALYFGVYHAPVHVWRVWRGFTAEGRIAPGAVVSANAAIWAVGATMVLSWLLGAGLWWLLATHSSAAMDWADALRWLIVAFAALTAPHLVVISLSEAFLTQRGK